MFRELRSRINWQRDAVMWGRLFAVTVVVLGTIAVALDPWELGGDFGNATRVRISITMALGIVWLGSLVLIVTEVAARLQSNESRPLTRVPGAARALGAAIIVIGGAVSIWNAIELGDAQESITGNAIRYAVSSMIHPFLWQGSLLILLATVAGSLGSRINSATPAVSWRDVVMWGWLLSGVTIVLGSGLAIWWASDVPDTSSDIFGSHYPLRTAIRNVLFHVWYGALIFILAAIVSVARGGSPRGSLITSQIPQLTRVLAAIILLAGTAVTIWDIQAMHDVYESSTGFLRVFSAGPGRTASDDIRYLLEAELQTYLWQGGLLILLAALVDRLPRLGDDTPNEGEVSLVSPES